MCEVLKPKLTRIHESDVINVMDMKSLSIV